MTKNLKKIVSAYLKRVTSPPGGKRIRLRNIPQAQYDGLSALKCCIWYNQYGGYCLPESSLHRTAPRKVLRGEAYEPQTLEFMRAHVGDGDIVHAGTYFGDFLPALGQACASTAKIWAFEPNPENFRCASITKLINDLQVVNLQHAGLGSEKSVLRMRIADASGTSLGGKSHIVDTAQFDPAIDIEIPIVAVDEVVPSNRNVSIVQLDVEDHERAALTGALKTIRRCRPTLILEVRQGNDLLGSRWFADNILSLGYLATNQLHGNTVFECERSGA